MLPLTSRFPMSRHPDDDVFTGSIRFILLVLVILGALTAGFLLINRQASPFREETSRLTTQQSTRFVQGNIGELRRLIREHGEAAPEHRSAIRQLILTAYDQADASTLPSDITTFVATLSK